MRILKSIKLADVFTLSNAALGCTALFLAIRGAFTLAVVAVIVAGIFDLFDGKIARMTGTANSFGQELDSLADIISFGAAPVVIGFLLMPLRIHTIVAVLIFLLCGIIRVAKFNISNDKRIYKGMPITMNAVIFPAAYLLKFPSSYLFWVYIVSAALMITPFRFRKPAILE